MGKISDYSNTATVLEDGDLMDVSKRLTPPPNPTYESQQFPYDAFAASVLAVALRIGAETLSSGANAVAFSSPLPSDDYEIIVQEVNGKGTDIDGIVKTANGFSIDALDNDTKIVYFAILNP